MGVIEALLEMKQTIRETRSMLDCVSSVLLNCINIFTNHNIP